MRCDECGIVDTTKYKHGVMCSQQRDLECIKSAYEWLQNYQRDQNRRHVERLGRLVVDVTHWKGKFLIVKEENNILRRKLDAEFLAENERLKNEIARRDESPIKAVWGGEHPFAIFLHDGTKISIDGNKQGCWLKIGKAAKIHALELIENAEEKL